LTALRGAVSRLPASVAAEVIVVADGPPVDPADAVREADARLVTIEGPLGPAAARSRGAAVAQGDLLAFVDADIVVEEDALARLVAVFAADPDLAAAFGGYDEKPADTGFFSQCRNLAHCHIHQRSRREAQTFWAGLGAVRASVFNAVGGFDERFGHPCVEDIDLGYRIRSTGASIVLDPTIRGTHLKRWTLWSSVVSDVWHRGVPWTQLLSRYGRMQNDLNITVRYRACVIAAYLLILAGAGAWFWGPSLALVPVMLVFLWWLDRPYYRFFVDQRGWLFTLRWFPFHVLHHLCNGVSFVVGTSLYQCRRWTGLALPGALPLSAWSRSQAGGGSGSYIVR
jgi:GT2 family glycosyltransferase